MNEEGKERASPCCSASSNVQSRRLVRRRQGKEVERTTEADIDTDTQVVPHMPNRRERAREREREREANRPVAVKRPASKTEARASAVKASTHTRKVLPIVFL